MAVFEKHPEVKFMFDEQVDAADLRAFYESLLQQGFTEEQALELTKVYLEKKL